MLSGSRVPVSKVIPLFLVLLVFFLLCGTAAASIPINTPSDLASIGSSSAWPLDGDYYLNANIDMNGITFTPIGNQTNPFIGSFDGQNFTISNLNINVLDTEAGLFGYTENAVIQNVTLTNVVIEYSRSGIESNSTGALVGFANNTTIESCHVLGGTVTGVDRVGGLIGEVWGGTLNDSTADVNVIGSYFVGGFVGHARYSANINNSSAYGTVNGGSLVGGFAGNIDNSTVSNSYANVAVTGNINEVGGFVGNASNNTSIDNSSADSAVTGQSAVGGFAGRVDNSTISDCEAGGGVTGNNAEIGGFVGTATYFSNIDNSSAYGIVTGISEVGGFAGNLLNNSVITNSYAMGNAESSVTIAGGFVGRMMNQSRIDNGSAFGNVNSGSGGEAGGFVGTAGNWSDMNATYINNSSAYGTVRGQSSVGGFAGRLMNATISNCSATGDVTNSVNVNEIGGFVGNASNGTRIDNSSAFGTVSGVSAIGGFAGRLDYSNITDSIAEGNVTGSSTVIGGFVGNAANSSNIVNSSAYGSTVTGDSEVGGFAGSLLNFSTVFNCSAIGNVTSNQTIAGGFAGRILNGTTVDNSSASGDVTITNIASGDAGGFVGTTGDWGSNPNRVAINNSSASGNVVGASGVGGFAGSFVNTTVSNCSAEGDAAGRYNEVGGFVGNASNNTSIENSSAIGNATGMSTVGGFVGNLNNSTVSNGRAEGNATGTNNQVGGFVGTAGSDWLSDPSIIVTIINNSSASGTATGESMVGGFVGRLNNASISTSYAEGDTTSVANHFVGGFGGWILNSTVSNCYARGNVTGSGINIGGFVGLFGSEWDLIDTSSIINCYAVGTVTSNGGSSLIGGFVGNATAGDAVDRIQFSFFREDNINRVPGDDFANPRSAAELMAIATFLNAPRNPGDSTVGPWNISNVPISSTIWYILEGEDYPRFHWAWAPDADIIYVNETLFAYIGDMSSRPDALGGAPKNWTLNSTYILVENINMTNVSSFTPFGSTSPFTGTLNGSYNGQYFTISNLNIADNSTDNLGLFSHTNGATIKNVNLTNVVISNVSNSTGSLIGFAENTVIENCNAAGSVGGNGLVGGLVGGMTGGTVINSQANVIVAGNSNVGGLVGVAWQGTELVGSSAIGLVTGSGNVGGFAGNLNNTTVSDCRAEGGVIGNTNVGGFAGNSERSRIDGSSASGTVSEAGSANSMGGFVGNLQNSTVSNSWAEGDVTGTPDLSTSWSTLVGGFAGNIANSTVSDCYADGIVRGVNNVGGFAGVIQLRSVIDSSEAFGNVIGIGDYPSMIGGFVGNLGNSTISGGYAGGSVTSNGSHTGGFAGVAQNGSGIVDSRAEGTVTGFTSVGGFAGQIANSTIIENCRALGDVTGNNNIGGFVGVTWRSDPAWREPKIDNSSASGNVTGIDSGSPSYIIGGFGGSLQNTIISRCYAEGTVTGGGDSSQFVGGFAANFVNSTVSVSYAAGDVTGASLVGGFAGRLIHTAVSNCYARGNVTGSGSSIYYVGGFVGILESAGSGTDTSLIKYCYATGTVTAGSNNVGGFAGTVKDQSVNPIQFSFFRDGNNAGGDVFANPESSVNLMDITTFLNAPKNPVESGIIESWNISVAPGSTSQPLLVMFSMSTSSAFGTPTIWYLIEGEDYPKFFWEWAKIEVTVTANSAVYDFDGTAKSVGGFSVDWANGNPEGAVLSGLSVPTVSRTAPGTTPVVFAGTPVITIGGTDVTAYYNITIVDGTLVINGSTGGGGGSGTGNATVVPPGNGTPPEPPTPPTPPTPPEPPTPPGNGPGGISWIWYAVLVAVAIIGLFFLILFYRRRNEEEEELEKI